MGGREGGRPPIILQERPEGCHSHPSSKYYNMLILLYYAKKIGYARKWVWPKQEVVLSIIKRKAGCISNYKELAQKCKLIFVLP